MFESVFDAAPTNEFLQDARRRYFAKRGIELPKEETNSGENGSMASALANKQKWKMLKNMPGKHSGNTWQAMGVLNKGLPSMGKTAAGGVAMGAMRGAARTRVPTSTQRRVATSPTATQPAAAPGRNYAKDYGVPTAMGAGLIGTNMHASHLADKAMNRTENMIGNVNNQWMGLAERGIDQGVNAFNQQAENFRQTIDPLANLNRGLSAIGTGLMSIPGILKNKYNSLAQQIQNPQTDPNADLGMTWWEQNQQMMRRRRRQMELEQLLNQGQEPWKMAGYSPKQRNMRTTFDALQVALNGSEQFQKSASAGEKETPDTLLRAHLRFADEMEKAAEYFATQENARPFAKPFKEAAAMVRKGYPAKTAMGKVLRAEQKLAAQATPVLERMASELLKREVARSYQKKVAAHLAEKKTLQNKGFERL